MSRKIDPQIQLLLQLIDQAYNKQAWHGPNLRGAIRGVKIDEALWRPQRQRHNIAEFTLHAAYWKYAAKRRLTGEKRGSFPLKGSNWWEIKKLDEATWKDHVKLLDTQHAELREAIANLPQRALKVVPKGCKVTNANLAFGIAHHDVYHAGQVRLLKSLYKNRK